MEFNTFVLAALFILAMSTDWKPAQSADLGLGKLIWHAFDLFRILFALIGRIGIMVYVVYVMYHELVRLVG